MRAVYALIGLFLFLIMLALMVWTLVDEVPFWMFIPAMTSGVLGLMFFGASRNEGSEQ